MIGGRRAGLVWSAQLGALEVPYFSPIASPTLSTAAASARRAALPNLASSMSAKRASVSRCTSGSKKLLTSSPAIAAVVECFSSSLLTRASIRSSFIADSLAACAAASRTITSLQISSTYEPADERCTAMIWWYDASALARASSSSTRRPLSSASRVRRSYSALRTISAMRRSSVKRRSSLLIRSSELPTSSPCTASTSALRSASASDCAASSASCSSVACSCSSRRSSRMSSRRRSLPSYIRF
mmetsp:Transcript_39109/g.103028  ORF Transcript_39109/g.103028 Transcript_39109/m.103028 type:complete len:244 (+) Transcript_39109:235-966(+)